MALPINVVEALRYGNLYSQSGTSPPLGPGGTIFVSSVPQIVDIAIVEISLKSNSSELLVEMFSYPGDASLITGAFELSGDSAPVCQNERFINEAPDFKLYFLTDNVAAQSAADASRQTFQQSIYSKDENATLDLNRQETRCQTQPGRSQIVKITNVIGNNKTYSAVTRWIQFR